MIKIAPFGRYASHYANLSIRDSDEGYIERSRIQQFNPSLLYQNKNHHSSSNIYILFIILLYDNLRYSEVRGVLVKGCISDQEQMLFIALIEGLDIRGITDAAGTTNLLHCLFVWFY